MPKAKHRKRVRAARQDAATAPIGGGNKDGDEPQCGKKVGKKEAEVANILDKLRSSDVRERVQGSAALSSMLLHLPPVTLRLLLAKNLIGLLIERLTDSEDEVVVESLGALRNLAVSSPLSLLSEMHNKRLLLPITSSIIPLLAQLLPSMLQPATGAQNGSAGEADRRKSENRRRLYWDWAENVLTLIWCLAESNTKILASLNAQPSIVPFCSSFLSRRALGKDAQTAKGKKKQSNEAQRVPLYVAVAAAQALSALISSNSPGQQAITAEVLSSLQEILSTTAPTGSSVKTDTHQSTTQSDIEDWTTLRVLAFGILLEMSNGHKRFKHLRDELRPHASFLFVATQLDLAQCVADLSALPLDDGEQVGSSSSDKLASYERRLTTMQTALEVLSEYLAALDSLCVGDLDEEEEEWQGIVDDDGDAEMESDGDANEFILRRPRPEDELNETDMSDALQSVELGKEDVDLLTSLPSKLVALATPTNLSFLPPQTTVVSNTSTLLPTTATESQPMIPVALVPLADTITLIHVRALECANNLFITLGRSSVGDWQVWRNEWQAVFETVLELVRGAATSVSSDVKAQRDGSDRKDGMREDEEHKLEFVMAGTGVVWGLCRLGLNKDEGDLLNVVPAVSAFLLELFNHPFARLLTPAGESIRVRIAGALGCLGRRKGVTADENAAIGDALLQVLPRGKESSELAPTVEVLIQTIDSLIDLYADEESAYDAEVFRKRDYLTRLDSAVVGVRAATKKIDKKRFPALRSRADGALENLAAFTQYRRDVAK